MFFLKKPQCYFNGKITSECKIGINNFERAINYGDSIFETIRVDNFAPQHLAEHLARLAKSCNLLQINFAMQTEDIAGIIAALCKKNNLPNCVAKIIVSRGGGSGGYLPLQNNATNILIKTAPLPPQNINNKIMFSSYIRQNILREGQACLDGKTANSIQFVMAKMEAQQNKCFDALMLNNEGYICEFSSGNVFLRMGEDDIFYTPSPQCGIVNGIMRNAFINQLTQDGKIVNQGFYRPQSIPASAKIYFTNAIRGVVEVCF